MVNGAVNAVNEVIQEDLDSADQKLADDIYDAAYTQANAFIQKTLSSYKYTVKDISYDSGALVREARVYAQAGKMGYQAAAVRFVVAAYLASNEQIIAKYKEEAINYINELQKEKEAKVEQQ